MIQPFALMGITQRPAHVASMPYELKVRILTGGDSTVDLSDTALKLFFQFGELLPNRLPEDSIPPRRLVFPCLSTGDHPPGHPRSCGNARCPGRKHRRLRGLGAAALEQSNFVEPLGISEQGL